MAAQEIRVPDIGDFTDVPIIEILVNPGDTVAAEDPLLTLESDKATLDVPSPVAGTIVSLAVAIGDTVSAGHRDRHRRRGGRGRRGRTEGIGHQPACRGGNARRRSGERRRTPRGPDGAGRVRIVGCSAERARPGRCAGERPHAVHRDQG